MTTRSALLFLFCASLLGAADGMAATSMLASEEAFGVASPEWMPKPPKEPRVIGGVTTIAAINANCTDFSGPCGLVGPGFSPLEFALVTIEGVVQLDSGILDPIDSGSPSTWLYVADGTGSVALVRSGVSVAFTAGTRVRVTNGQVLTRATGVIRGTRTLDLAPTTITVIGSGTPDAALPATANDIRVRGADFEGTRVRISGLHVVPGEVWPASGVSGFVRVFAGTDTVRLFVDEETDLDGAFPPSGSFDLVGFVAQNDPAPFNDQHYVYPSSVGDILTGDGSGSVSVDPALVVEGASVTLAFTLRAQEATLATLEIVIPKDWTWETPDLANVTLSGVGFGSAVPSFRSEGGTFVIEVTGASVTSSATGTVSVAELHASITPGISVFVARTATDSGTPTEIASSPTVRVLTDAGEGSVVINELFPVTTTSEAAAGAEDSEFIELFNPGATELDISGWTVSDIGRSSGCELDASWAFPVGTVLSPGGYVVVCRTARDPSSSPPTGFLVDFPGFPPNPSALLFEMMDSQGVPGSGDADDLSTPNMVLVDPTTGDDQMALLGGNETNQGQCETGRGRRRPFTELVLLRDFLGEPIDALEYREPGPCEADLCMAGPAAGIAYPYGPPQEDATLGRDALSTDTDDSSLDLFPSSMPTPGEANVPGDSVAPTLVLSANPALSNVLVEIRYDEVMGPSAADPSSYSVTTVSTGEEIDVLDVIVDADEGGRVTTKGGSIEVGRHYALFLSGIPPGEAVDLSISGVRDLEILGSGGNELDTTITFSFANPEAVPICDVQSFDEIGFSPFELDTVLVTGFVTLGDIAAVESGAAPPTDRVTIWVQEPGGCGVNVFSFLPDLGTEYDTEFHDVRLRGIQINDLVQVRGRVTEFVSASSGAGAVTEVAGIVNDPAFYRFVLHALEGPEPVRVTTKAANDERLEGTLVRTEGTVINSNALAAFIDDGTGSIQVFQNFSSLDLTRFTVGDRLDVTGVITQFDSSIPYFSGYELVPQKQDAIVLLDPDVARDGPVLVVDRHVLVPELGEKIEVRTISPARSDVIVEIYDAIGRKVTTLYDGVGLGPLTFHWDGRGQDGSKVKPGVYLCHMRAVALDGGSVKTDTAPIVVGLTLE